MFQIGSSAGSNFWTISFKLSNYKFTTSKIYLSTQSRQSADQISWSVSCFKWRKRPQPWNLAQNDLRLLRIIFQAKNYWGLSGVVCNLGFCIFPFVITVPTIWICLHGFYQWLSGAGGLAWGQILEVLGSNLSWVKLFSSTPSRLFCFSDPTSEI